MGYPVIDKLFEKVGKNNYIKAVDKVIDSEVTGKEDIVSEINTKIEKDIKEISVLCLGEHRTQIKRDTLIYDIYKSDYIYERHRHGYGVNNNYRELIEQNGMLFTGTNLNGKTLEIMELPTNKFFIGVQYHPEFSSRPNNPHKLFNEFVETCFKNKE